MTARPECDEEPETGDTVSDESSGEDFYLVLGAEPTASDEQLKALYRKLVLQCHPDKVSGDKERALLSFHRLDQAWKTLSDPELRSRYDSRQRAEQLTRTLVNDELDLEDMDWNEEEESYYHSCRCGGEYILAAAEASFRGMPQHRGSRLVNCSNCSLCIQVSICDGHVAENGVHASVPVKR